MRRDFPFVVALVAVSGSIASFIALMETSSPGRALIALDRVSFVLLPLSVAFALAVQRRPTIGAWQAQVATATTSLAFGIVALVKLYATSSTTGVSFEAVNWADQAAILGTGALAFGLIGPRVRASAARIGFVAAVAAAVSCTGYAISLQPNTKAFVWYLVAGAAAALAGSAAARMHRR